MPDYRRLYADGGIYFLTLCLDDRRSDLLVRYIDLLRASWLDVVASRPVETIAAVVLREHMHFLWQLPDNDCDFPTRVAQLKAGFTRRLPEVEKGKGRKRERGIWQRRFWEHCIKNDGDLSRHIDYIHWNPVKHGLVDEPDDWPYSTYHEWKKNDGRPINVSPDKWRPVHLGERL